MAAGAITATAQRMLGGAIFSHPYMRSSLVALVPARLQRTEQEKDAWAFLKPFSSNVWIAIIATIVIVPLLIVIFENLLQARGGGAAFPAAAVLPAAPAALGGGGGFSAALLLAAGSDAAAPRGRRRRSPRRQLGPLLLRRPGTCRWAGTC